MKYYKGTLYYHIATGEESHFYAWLGDEEASQHDWENHLPISPSDIIEVRSKDKKNGIVLRFFPADMKELRKTLKKKGWKIWQKAVTEHWEIEVVKFNNNTLS